MNLTKHKDGTVSLRMSVEDAGTLNRALSGAVIHWALVVLNGDSTGEKSSIDTYICDEYDRLSRSLTNLIQEKMT